MVQRESALGADFETPRPALLEIHLELVEMQLGKGTSDLFYP
jgi:hypothetical protein